MAGAVNKIVNYTFRLNGAGQAQSRMRGLATAAAGIGLAIAGATTQLFMMANRLTQNAAAIEDFSRQTGIAASELAGLGYIAEQDGASLEALGAGIKRMTRTINDAEDGLQTYIRSFDALGISVDQLSGQSVEEQFYIIAEAMSKVADDSTRAALAQEIFGRGGMQLIPMLDRGREGIEEMADEARELGIILDDEVSNYVFVPLNKNR